MGFVISLVTAPLTIVVLTLAGCAHSESQNSNPAVGLVRRAYVDSSRQAWGSSASRPLVALVWFPTDVTAPAETLSIGPPAAPLFVAGEVVPNVAVARRRGGYPLIVLSHGTGGSAVQLAWLGLALARHGYIVAALNHHGNTGSEGRFDARGFFLWWERARDVSVVIDRLLDDPVFGSAIDTARIGAGGFSLGGYTVLELAGARTDLAGYASFCASPERDFTCEAQPEMPSAPVEFDRLRGNDPAVQISLARAGASYRDERIKAVMAIAPAVGRALTPTSLTKMVVPILIVVGDSDQAAPPATNADYVHSLAPKSEIIRLPLVGHYTFLSICTDGGRRALPAICQDLPGVSREATHGLVSAAARTFFDRTLAVRQ